MMNINEFITELLKNLRIADSALHTEEHYTTKTNGVRLRGILMYKHCKTLAPIVYVDHLYSQYMNGKSINTLVTDLLSFLDSSEENYLFDTRAFEIYDNIREQLRLELVNYNWNEDALQSRPHVRFLDLACQYYVDLGSSARFTVSNALLETWGVVPETVCKDAYISTQVHMKFEVTPIEDVIHSLAQEAESDFDMDELYTECSSMFVLTNVNKNYGACGIVYQDNLKIVAEQCQSDLIILPSSTHEVLLLPSTGLPRNTTQLKEMVREINYTQVDPTERLSDNIYFYNKSENTLSLI